MAKSKKSASAPEKRRYQLIAGIHQDAQGLHEAKDPRTRIVESTSDLAKKFPEKFRRLGDTESLPSAPASGVVDAQVYENMTNEQLAQVAMDNEVDLTGAQDREDVIELLKNALGTGENELEDDDNA